MAWSTQMEYGTLTCVVTITCELKVARKHLYHEISHLVVNIIMYHRSIAMHARVHVCRNFCMITDRSYSDRLENLV